MREGLYDSLLTARLAQQLVALRTTTAHTQAVDEPDAPTRFAHFLAGEVRRLLGDLHGDERVEKQAAIVNDLLAFLKQRLESEPLDAISTPPKILLAIHSTPEPPPRP